MHLADLVELSVSTEVLQQRKFLQAPVQDASLCDAILLRQGRWRGSRQVPPFFRSRHPIAELTGDPVPLPCAAHTVF